ncbi:MAG TPA: tetratricopeptide repeat protein [Candidatus Obscuribacterales bacterium]
MPGHRSSVLTLIALVAAVTLVHASAVSPAFAQKGHGVVKPHVYPGAQPISPAPSAQQPADTANPEPDMGTPPQPEAAGKPAQDDQAEQQPETQSADTAERPSGAHASGSSDSADKADAVSDVSPEEQEAAQQAQQQAKATQHYDLAKNYFGKWDLDMAEIEFDETVMLYPDFRVAHRDLCLLSLAKLNFGRSVAEFMMVTGLTEPIPYTPAETAALNDRAMKAHYNKALAWGKKDNWPEAITELLWSQNYSPADAMVHHSLAFAYASSGDFARAEDEYKTVFKDAPQDGMAHADFANMLVDRGNPALAEDEMKRAVALAPNAAALHVDLGWLAESHKDLTTAENEFREAVKLSPKHAGLWTHLARIEEHQGQVSDAQKSYEQALQLDSQNVEARDSLDRLKQQAKPDA